MDDVQSANPIESLEMRKFEVGPGAWYIFSTIGWLAPDATRPLREVLGFASETITGAEALQVTAAEIFTFAPGTTEIDNAAASSGKIVFVADHDHPVWLIYADRSTTVHMSDVTLADGSALDTPPAGLSLKFGWNIILVQPLPGADEHLLESVANWTLILEGRQH